MPVLFVHESEGFISISELAAELGRPMMTVRQRISRRMNDGGIALFGSYDDARKKLLTQEHADFIRASYGVGPLVEGK